MNYPVMGRAGRDILVDQDVSGVMTQNTAPSLRRTIAYVDSPPRSAFAPTNTPKLAYTIPQAVDACGISRRTLYRYISDKTLPIVKIGQRTLIRSSDLATFIDQRLVA